MSQATELEARVPNGTLGARAITAMVLTVLAWVALAAGFMAAPVIAITGLIVALTGVVKQEEHRRLFWGLTAANVVFMIVFVLLMIALIPTGQAPPTTGSTPAG